MPVKELVPTERASTAASTNFDPIAVQQKELKKTALFERAVRHPLGLSKLAAALQNPVRKYLDVVPIYRQNTVVEPMPAGMIAYFDADIHEFSGVKIGEDGSARFIIAKALRTWVPPFEVAAFAKVPYKEIWWRKYKVLDRAKERIRQAIAIKEDLLGFSLLHDAATLVNNQVDAEGSLKKDALASCFKEIERHRLIASSIILSPEGIYGIRKWQRDQVDEVARIEIRQTGYIGNIFGANFYVTNLIRPISDTECFAYIVSTPQFVSWMPMWTQLQITPADRPDDLLIGFNGYELLGMIVHNARAVVRLKFNPKK